MTKKTLSFIFLLLAFVFSCVPTISSAQIFCNGKSCAVDGSPIDATAQVSNSPQFISGFTPTTPGTLSSLYTNAPCNAVRSNYYAVVSDLYGVLNEALRCTNFGPWGYGWRATIPFYAAAQNVSGGTLTVSCNSTPPVLRLTGSLTSSLTVVFSSSNCTPGQRQEVQTDLSLGLYSVISSGLTGAVTTKTLGASGTTLYVFDTAGWRPY